VNEPTATLPKAPTAELNGGICSLLVLLLESPSSKYGGYADSLRSRELFELLEPYPYTHTDRAFMAHTGLLQGKLKKKYGLVSADTSIWLVPSRNVYIGVLG
jgi:hypothetical protein